MQKQQKKTHKERKKRKRRRRNGDAAQDQATRCDRGDLGRRATWAARNPVL